MGCGSVGERHIRNIRGLQAVEIITCDLKQDELSKIKKEYGVKKTYTDLKEALSQKINVVLICTPNTSYVPIALLAKRSAETGKVVEL